MGLTILIWVFLMNLMDLVPVDWVPELFKHMGVEYTKIVPTTDINVTLRSRDRGLSDGDLLQLQTQRTRWFPC